MAISIVEPMIVECPLCMQEEETSATGKTLILYLCLKFKLFYLPGGHLFSYLPNIHWTYFMDYQGDTRY